jgi:hypothetical protein
MDGLMDGLMGLMCIHSDNDGGGDDEYGMLGSDILDDLHTITPSSISFCYGEQMVTSAFESLSWLLVIFF